MVVTSVTTVTVVTVVTVDRKRHVFAIVFISNRQYLGSSGPRLCAVSALVWEDLELITHLMNYANVYRTALATPVLFTTSGR